MHETTHTEVTFKPNSLLLVNIPNPRDQLKYLTPSRETPD